MFQRIMIKNIVGVVLICFVCLACFSLPVLAAEEDNVNETQPLFTTSPATSEEPLLLDEDTLLSWYRPDRLLVYYARTQNQDILPWQEIYYNKSRQLVKIPSSMTLKEAIESCKQNDVIIRTVPGLDDYQFTSTSKCWYVSPSLIKVEYNPRTIKRLPWEEVRTNGDIHTYRIPSDMTLQEAFAVCNRYDNILQMTPYYISDAEMPLLLGSSVEEYEPVMHNSYGDIINVDVHTLLSWYPQDKLIVQYFAGPNKLPWEVIYEGRADAYGSEAVVKIPEGMTLMEAVEYCHNQPNIFATDPDYYLITNGILDGGYIPVYTDIIPIIYAENSPFRLSWELIDQFNDIYSYKKPENMTLQEAMQFCGDIDDIIGLYYAEAYSPSFADASQTNSTTQSTSVNTPSPTTTTTVPTPTTATTPVPIFGIIVGGLVGYFLITRRN